MLNSLEKLTIMKNNYHTPRDTKIFEEIEKDLKTYEIMKKYFKQVFRLLDTSGNVSRTDHYRIIFKSSVQSLQITDTELTKEEHDLLSGVLENDK